MGVPLRAGARCRLRKRLDARLPDVPLGPRAARHGNAGSIGGPLIILSFVLQLFDVYKNGSGPGALLSLPEIAWEISLGIYSAWKGFRLSSPLASPEIAIAD